MIIILWIVCAILNITLLIPILNKILIKHDDYIFNDGEMYEAYAMFSVLISPMAFVVSLITILWIYSTDLLKIINKNVNKFWGIH